MATLEHAQELVDQIKSTKPNLTQLRGIAKEIGKNQDMANDLWASGNTSAMLVSLLILDLKATTTQSIDRMIADIESAPEQDQRQLSDWLIANVMMKKSALKQAATTWRTEPSRLKQRIFWSVQARSVNVENEALNRQLLDALELSMADAEEMVQEPMNWCAAQIGIADEHLRERCIQLGERLQLYINYPVSKGCTSPYLPIWIRSVVGKNEMAAD